ncbi:LOW QUALITY PROTEIN: coiled-coil domain-containing protein 186-like [Penaeus monodon]|uniref:LOW QUALITY PROTEIN: coiled-coil domain-containing protein 186-like n=1 Tax=Penaeus monodon TaxID=6687 RepID=UPI0018A77F59|nr:LOW QUALITY PROTEIN: coiled-coil domain-containing protein 186-like [Penaeus monodon]
MDEQKSEQNADYLDGEGDKGCIMNHSSESSEQNDTSCSREREVSPIKCDVNIPNDSIDGSPSDNVSEDVVDKCIRVTVEQNESFCSLNSEGSGVCNDENGSMNERQVETLLRAPTRTDVGKKERLDTEEKDTSLLMSESYLRDESVVEFTVDSKDEDESTDGEEQVDVLQYTSENIKDVSSETETTEENKSLESLNSDEKLPPLHLLPQEIKNASLLTEIEDLLTTTACSPDSGFEVSKIDVSSTSKENLMKMISSLLDECDTLKKEKTRLEGEVDRLEADQSAIVYTQQIETLEKTLAQAQADACSWQQRLKEAEENYLAENIKIRTDLTARLERMTKQYEAANKDKESMVIKYATSEREVIVARQQKEAVEKKMKEMEKEREQLLSKNKMLIGERARICQTLDTKVQKINSFQREVDRLKEEVSSREVKIKWAQTKLKSEMDAHKETQAKLDRALTKITKHEEELRSIKEEAEKVVRSTRDDENSRANVLDKQLKEEKARLIMERQVFEDRGSAFNKVSAELESLKAKHSTLVEEATSLRSKVTTYEAEREESEKLFTSLRQEVKNARQEAGDLSLQLSNSAHLQQQLQREREQLASATQENERLQTTNNELESDLLTCRQKEAELLAFTQKLSDKNVQIQSQLSALQSKSQLLELEHGELKSELENIKAQRNKIKTDLTKENEMQNAQVEDLTRQLAEKSEELKQLTTKASDLENEIQVLKKKHNNSLKDISREMQKLRKRLELHESGNGNGAGGNGGGASGRSSQSVTPHDTLSQGSRASSNASLNNIEYQSTNGSSPQSQENLPSLNDPLVTQQLLVDRIIKLQKSAAKKAEKIEFLEEHVAQLVSELKKKSRIIHHYIMKEEAGALANSASDTSKAELMKHGGIMASVYGSSARDDTMTLDLSLEINRKLQAVLEDTLLKNITLKENLNTLGDEIAKISLQNQQLETRK